MHALRAFLRDHRRLVASLIVLALAMKALVPAGYMVGAKAHLLTVEICADAQGAKLTKHILVPADGKSGDVDHAKAEGTCAWSALGMASLGGTDAALLMLALGFILLLGFAPTRPAPRSRALHLRPPLRGPPSLA